LAEGEEPPENIGKQREIKNWILQELESIDDRFATHLQLEHFPWPPSWIDRILYKIKCEKSPAK